MFELRTVIDINAPAERVWRHLTDFAQIGSWNPYLRHVSGDLQVGGLLTVTAQPSRSPGRTFRPVVLKVDPPRTFRWVWALPLPVLFRGEHIFEIEAEGQDRCRLIHREEFSGVLAWIHRIFRFSATRRGFVEMNEALRARAELGA